MEKKTFGVFSALLPLLSKLSRCAFSHLFALSEKFFFSKSGIKIFSDPFTCDILIHNSMKFQLRFMESK